MRTGTLFSTPGELAQLSKTLTRLALFCSLAAAVIIGIAALVSGDTSLIPQAIAPGLVAVSLSILVLLKKEHAPTVLLGCTLAVVVSYRIVGTSATTLAATTAIVILAMLSSLFVTKHEWLYVGSIGVLLIVTPVVWGSGLEEALPAGLVMSVAYIIGSVVIMTIRGAAFEASARYREAFESAPVALIELEWSDALIALQDLDISDEGRAELAADNPDLVRRIAARTEVVRANEEAVRLLGFSRGSDVAGLVVDKFLAEALLPAWTQQIAMVSQDEAAFESEVVINLYGKPLSILVRTVSRRRTSQSYRSVVSFTDVTASRILENSLKELIEAKDEFIASVSHELRTPLTAVLGLSEELAGDGDFTVEERTELLEIISGQSREMAYIVEDLLVGARADNGTITVRAEPIDIADLARRVVIELDFACQFEDRIDHDWSTIGDGVRIRQILRNLVVNAQRYGGPERRIILYRDDAKTVLEIRDTGEPLPLSAAERIFSSYERAHHRPGITAAMGLGLSVSRRLARMMGGDLTYDHDGETIFRVTLPAMAVERASVAS